jgi:hypothetical protein
LCCPAYVRPILLLLNTPRRRTLLPWKVRPFCSDRRHATTVSLLFDSCDQTKRVARPASRPKTRTIPSAFVDVALDSPSMFNSEKCTLAHLSANTQLISPGGLFF